MPNSMPVDFRQGSGFEPVGQGLESLRAHRNLTFKRLRRWLRASGNRTRDTVRPMRTEAVKAGFYQTLYGSYPKIQILTIRELFEGKQPNIPLVDSSSFKRAAKEKVGDQDALPF